MARIGRRIAFDHGDVRIGVAICDPDGILATPIATLQSKSPTLKSEITKILEEYEPVKAYVGNPKLLSGENGEEVGFDEENGECQYEKTPVGKEIEI